MLLDRLAILRSYKQIQGKIVADVGAGTGYYCVIVCTSCYFQVDTNKSCIIN